MLFADCDACEDAYDTACTGCRCPRGSCRPCDAEHWCLGTRKLAEFYGIIRCKAHCLNPQCNDHRSCSEYAIAARNATDSSEPLPAAPEPTVYAVGNGTYALPPKTALHSILNADGASLAAQATGPTSPARAQ